MALRPAPKRKPVDYQKLDDLQKEIFGFEQEDAKTSSIAESEVEPRTKTRSQSKTETAGSATQKKSGEKAKIKSLEKEEKGKDSSLPESSTANENPVNIKSNDSSTSENLNDLETIAARITSSRAGQGRITTRPFSLPRTLIIDTTRLKAQFRLIDEQFTQNVIVDFLLREALSAITPDNYQDLRTEALEFIKRAEETTRRSLTVTEEVIYQMSELKAGINLETGKKYSNDEIFSTLLAIGVSWLYRNGVLS